MSDYLFAALRTRAALDPLIQCADGKAEFPYAEVRDAVAAFVGRSREELPPYEIMIQQQRLAKEWANLLYHLEARMLHLHQQEKMSGR